MGRVFLVRHAQASFLEPDYDKLSATGETQARVLGEYWARHKVSFDRVCTGPRVRHRDTEKGVRETYAQHGLIFPESMVLEEFDEFQGDVVLEKSLPQLCETNSHIRDLDAAVQSCKQSATTSQEFSKTLRNSGHDVGERRTNGRRRRILGGVHCPRQSRSFAIPVHRRQKRNLRHLYFRRACRRIRAASLAPLAARHAASGMDASQLLV